MLKEKQEKEARVNELYQELSNVKADCGRQVRETNNKFDSTNELIQKQAISIEE
jgi:hypothetical protein